MPIRFAPRPGTILLCDYDVGRAVRLPHEMTKRRPVVVVSPRWRRHSEPLVVVPLSTSAPAKPDERHIRLPAGRYQFLRPDVDSWAKCEFIGAVSEARLDQPWQRHARVAPKLSDYDVIRIIRAVAWTIGCHNLISRS